MYTVIDEPFETNGTSGSSLDALNLSRSIYEEALPYLNIYKDIKAEPVDTTNSAVESTVELRIQQIQIIIKKSDYIRYIVHKIM